MDRTRIRWTDSTWNPMTGCTQISPGCDHCYAKVLAERLGPPAFPVRFNPRFIEPRLDLPARWREPRRVFVNSMSDLFHDGFGQPQIERVFDVMATVDRHTYQVLTKRPRRMAAIVNAWCLTRGLKWLPRHIWLGTSIERDDFVWRADMLRQARAPILFISAEPLLGPLPSLNLQNISWLIVGGESGPGWRPMDHAWARDLRDRAVAGGVRFFFKQSAAPRTEQGQELDGVRWEQWPDEPPCPAPAPRTEPMPL